MHRVPGQPLSRSWPTMTRDERRRAVGQIADMLRALHRFQCPDDVPEIDAPQLLRSHTFRAVDPLLGALDQLVTLPVRGRAGWWPRRATWCSAPAR